jgi:hypothetical protein
VPENAPNLIRLKPSVADREGKNVEDGPMISLPHSNANSETVADPPETQTLTPTTSKTASEILIAYPTSFCDQNSAHRLGFGLLESQKMNHLDFK